MATNISNLPISSSFQDLVLESGSILQNATGSVINNLTITSSFAITASHATNVPDTASFAVRATSASMADSASYAVSASVEITKEISSSYADVAGVAQSVAGGDVNGAVASASFAETASFFDGSVVSSSFAESASRAVSASMADSSSYAVLASDSRDLIIGVKSSQATTILKGQTLHATGVTGENINVVTASNDNSANMPAIAVANENINAGATSTAVISGKIIGIDTDGLVAGANVYVDVNGGITGTKPTGTALIQNIGVVGKIDAVDGELVVLGSGRSNDLPNITSGYFWVGNENQVPIAVATSSLSVVSASYANVAALAQNTEKADINPQNQDFNYNVVFGVSGSSETLYVDGGDQLEYNPSTNRLFNITSVEADNFTGSFQGNLAGTASFAVSASHTTDSSSFATSASYAVTASQADNIRGGINVSFNSGSFNYLTATSASIGHLRTVTGSAVIIGDEFILLNADTPVARYAGIKVYDSGSGVTASLEWDGETDNWILQEETGNTAVIITGPTGSRASEVSPGVNKIQKGGGHHTIIDSSITDTGTAVTIGNTTTFSNGASGSFSGSFEGELLVTASNALFATNALSASHAESSSVAVSSSFANTAATAVSASHAESASFYGGSVVSSSFAESSSFAQDARTADSALTATTASHALSIPGVITNDIEFEGVVSGDVNTITITSNTASIDFDTSNFFLLTMPAGGNVHVNATNIKNGTTVNLQVTQNATAATMDFADYIKFESGSEYTISTGSGNVDLISFVTFDTTNLLGAGINHLV